MSAAAPILEELDLTDDPGPWRALGFAVVDDALTVGQVRIRLGASADGLDARGLVGWSLRDVATTDLDGLRTRRASGPPPAPASHPNATSAIDHVVVVSGDLDRTAAAFERAGMRLRRVRETGGEQSIRQGFFRAGETIIEVVESARGLPGGRPPPSDGAAFWGLVFVVDARDDLAQQRGERLGPIRDAVQPGRRIAPLRRTAGVGAAVAFITAGAPRRR